MTTTQINHATPATKARGWTRTAGALLSAAAAGLALALMMPRGPMTSAQSLTALTLGLAVGVLAGWLMASRWAALLAPATFGAAFEIGRIGAVGPTVDAIRLDGLYGILALIVGRGFDVLVVGLPMVVAAFWGAALARRQHRDESAESGDGQPASAGGSAFWRAARGTSLVLATVVVVVLGAALARPASTDPILDANGAPLTGSIAELTTVPIGGHAQRIMLRGNDVEAPVLLFLEGGPGGTALGSMHYAGKPLEEHFTVATWDQRGTGKSASALEPLDTLTVAQAVSDTIEVTEYLRDRFDEERIYLLGSSWGTTLGTLVVQARPDLFHAYIGSGQMVDQQETDTLMYAESVDYAQRVGDTGFAEQLRAIGPPPYTDMLAYPVAIASNPEWHDFTHGPDHDARSTYPANLLVEEYTLTEKVRSAAALIDTFALMYPQLQDVDFRRDVPRLDVPVFIVEGAHEAPGRAVLARQWFELLSAPSKHLVTFESSGHTPHLHEPGRFAAYLADVVLAQTYPH
ncbi:MAG TPA: alpha/beta hydrolase [Candidatus Limnocylindrales bacterium]|nr:alpha/beta hydrolase [Candidatus Limnocylindrales bacterium]